MKRNFIPSKRKVIDGTHEMAHFSYLGLVSIEGHGLYAWAALVLLIAHGCKLCRDRFVGE